MIPACLRIPLLLLALVAANASDAAPAQTPAQTRLFILSGQSNMANLDPDDTFTPALRQAYPGDDLVVVKEAINGQQIRMWLKDWQPPAGMDARADGKPLRQDGNGRIYRTLLDKVTAALKDKPRPVSVAFCWMQGEADARAGYGAVYEASLRAVRRNLVQDLGRDDLTWVIGRISDYGNARPDEEPDWNRIRDIQVAVATSTPRSAWVDCDDLNGKDGLHYPAAGYRELGVRFAAATIRLLREPVPVPVAASSSATAAATR